MKDNPPCNLPLPRSDMLLRLYQKLFFHGLCVYYRVQRSYGTSRFQRSYGTSTDQRLLQSPKDMLLRLYQKLVCAFTTESKGRTVLAVAKQLVHPLERGSCGGESAGIALLQSSSHRSSSIVERRGSPGACAVGGAVVCRPARLAAGASAPEWLVRHVATAW